MKSAISVALLVLGTIVGTLGGAHLPRADWTIVAAGLVLLAAGALAGRRHGAAAGASTAALGEVIAKLEALPERVDALAAAAPDLELDALRQRIDRLAAELLAPVAERSPSLLPLLGATRFAEVFGAFASGERQLARAWSAAADRHAGEAIASLERAAARMHAARDAARALQPTAAPGNDPASSDDSTSAMSG